MTPSRAKATAMAHQTISLKHNEKQPIVFDTSDPGCVSADTEYLTPTGWKRFDAYTPGDQVAQFYPDTREIEFVLPLQYIKKPCTEMIAIAPVRGTSQRLSPEHRVLYYLPDGSHAVCSAEEYMTALYRKGGSHLKRKFCTTFNVRNNTHLGLTDAELRLQVAVIADGHFQNGNNRCTVRLKKARKIARLKELLAAAEVEWRWRQCGGMDPEFQVFTFMAPRHDKSFTSWWWGASQAQLEVIADELPYWDSSIDARPSNGVRFSTFIEESAHFAQYALSAAKHPTSLNYSFRNRMDEGRGMMVEYSVHARAMDQMIGPGRKESVYAVANPEGFKYCFEVPTSYLLLRHNGYIFATGNTGKTFVRIMAFAKRRAKKSGAMLVLAPRTLLRTVWFNDFKKFAPHLKVSVANAANREEAFAVDADVYVTNVDAVKWLATKPASFFKKFSELAIDESTAYKHHTSQRSKAVVKIAKHFKNRCLMTGTPNGNSITDVWHQVYILDEGKRLGHSFYKFRDTVCTPTQVGRNAQAIKWTDREGAEEAVFSLLSDIVIRHKFEDCVDIPANHRYTVPYELSPKQLLAYAQLEATQLLELSKGRITAINAAAVATKLLQVASGAVYSSPEVYHVVDTERYEMILDMVEQRKHSLVIYLWKHQRDLLVAEAEKRGIRYCVFDGESTDRQRAEMEQGYQAGVYQVMFGHPQTVAHGLTLTKGTATIWASPTYNLEWFVQGSKRQHRIGQKEKTETIIVVAPGTLEEKVYDSMMVKDTRMANLLDLFGTLAPAPKREKSSHESYIHAQSARCTPPVQAVQRNGRRTRHVTTEVVGPHALLSHPFSEA